MPRRCFYSFHFDGDCWRTGQVRNIRSIEGSVPVSGNDWEAVRRGGNAGIEKWIENQMKGRTCCIVLVGAQTADRPWVHHEINHAWNCGLGLVGVRVHGLKDQLGNTSYAGANPFSTHTLDAGTPKAQWLSNVVRVYDPPGFLSTDRYQWISDNLEAMVEEAISIRSRH